MMNLLQQREKYEVRLGHFATQHKIAINCAQEMIKVAKRYITVRASLFSRDCKQQHQEIERLLRTCCLSLNDHYTGRVGDSIEQLNRVFCGQGNLREMMAHIWAFANNLLCADLIGRNKLPGVLQIANSAGLNTSEIQEMAQQAIEFKSEAFDANELKPKDDFFCMPWHYVRQAQNAMRIKKILAETDTIWSDLTRGEFEAEGGVFNQMERQLLSNLGPNYVPWVDARKIWLLDESHDFVKTARKKDIPLIAGISGMTMQFLQLARILNISPLVNVRLSCLGYLLSTKSHSFHEVMAAAEYFGCSYQGECDYWDIIPLTADEIRDFCGLLPVEKRAILAQI